MKAKILGANGYIGSHLVETLYSKGWELICFDIQDKLSINLDIPYHQIDITNQNEVEKVDLSCDFLFYFIGITGTSQSFKSYDTFIKVNEIGFLNVLNTIKDLNNIPHVIFPSTRLVYKGKKDTPLLEDAEKEFKTIYASSKYNGELYLDMYNRLYGMKYSIFRICVPYGNVFSNGYSYGTIGFFMSKALGGSAIPLFGDGSLKRTFTHVKDICSQIINVILSDESENECYNVKGETFSLLEVATLISNKFGTDVVFTPWAEEALKLESGDTIFDFSKIEKVIKEQGFECTIHQWLNKNKK